MFHCCMSNNLEVTIRSFSLEGTVIFSVKGQIFEKDIFVLKVGMVIFSIGKDQ